MNAAASPSRNDAAAGSALLAERARQAARRAVESQHSLSMALLFSAMVHNVIAFGLGGQLLQPNPKLFQNNTQPLDVVLVNARSSTQPLNAEVLAQHNLDGGGEVDENRQAKSPLAASEADSPASQSPARQAQIQAVDAPREVLTQAKSDYVLQRQAPDSQNAPRPLPPVPDSQDLAEASLEMARLQARIEREWDSYQKRPRKTFVGARAQEYTFARYVDDWRLKVERVGNQNYPEAARRNGIYGTLVLTVEIMADGRLGEISIDRSSGSKVLDAAAVHIVEMSAPFAPFAEELRKKTDILAITRTWSFTRDQLTSR